MSSAPSSGGLPAGVGERKRSRRPIAVPVRFVTQMTENRESTVNLEDVYDDLDDQRLLAWELRADAEADLNRADSKRILAEAKAARSAAAEAKRLAQPCHDLLAALERQEAPAGLARLISREVQRAVREESVQLQGNLRQQLGAEAAAAAKDQMQELNLALGDLSKDTKLDQEVATTTVGAADSAKSDHEAIITRTLGAAVGLDVTPSAVPSIPSEGVQEDLAARLAVEISMEEANDARLLQFGEELRHAAEEARAEMDDHLAEKLRALREVLDDHAEQWQSPCWCEDIQDTPDQTGSDGCTIDTSTKRLEEAEQRLQALLGRTAETLELEYKARQESELWLLGRVQEVRQELRGMLLKVVSFVELQLASAAVVPKAAKAGSNPGVSSYPADGFLRLLGGAMSSISNISGRAASSTAPASFGPSIDDIRLPKQPTIAPYRHRGSALCCEEIAGLHPRQ